MSSLGPLFIPRKDTWNPPKIKDNPELEKSLSELAHRNRTNELAVQRWANSLPRITSLIGPCSAVTNNSLGTVFGVGQYVGMPLDGTLKGDFRGTVDLVNNQLIMPAKGYYAISGVGFWLFVPGVNVQPMSGSVEFLLYLNGAANNAPFGGSGTAPFLLDTFTDGGLNVRQYTIYPDYQSFTVTDLFNAGDRVDIRSHNLVFDSSANPFAVFTVHLLNITVDFLGNVPTPVQ